MIAQLVGMIPLILSFFVFIFNDRRKIIIFKGISDLLWALHFFLLGEMSGAIINSVNTVRNIVFFQKDKKWCNHRLIPILFCAFTVFGGIFSFDGIKGIFPMLGSCLAVIGFWCSKPDTIRKFNLPATLLWLIYGIMTKSVSTIICNTLSIISILTAALRLRREKAGT